MLSNFFKPINLICIFFYIVFMLVTFNSTAVDALVFYVTKEDEKPVYTAGKIANAKVSKSNGQVVALQFKPEKATNNIDQIEKISEPQIKFLKPTKVVEKVVENHVTTTIATTTQVVEKKPVLTKSALSVEPPKNIDKPEEEQPSAISYIKAISEKKWEYAPSLDRYVVKYDDNTYVVLTIRPTLQKQLEDIFKKYSTRIGVGIIQDPTTGEILAMSSCHKNQTLLIESEDFKTKHWALQATFPVASIFKIITAAAGIDSSKITSNSNFVAWKKSYMKVWKAFAQSHNGIFGKIAQKIGKAILEKYIDAFGFNKTFFFDLKVGKSIALLPSKSVQMAKAAAGLNRDFLVSPLHVASIISTVINRGKMMKPYLVDYVVRKNKVIFRRKPFQIAKPIKDTTARDIYKMMYATTAVGTAKQGFNGYKKCPHLAKICGGKTGTLTGVSPHYLFTWFGGFTKATGRDICIVVLVGQKSHSSTKASSIAGRIAYELYINGHGNEKYEIAAH